MIKLFSKQWIYFISKRFSRVDRTGRSATASFLASLGIAFAVMTLVVVVSVMNGFQMEFKDAIMELSSYHIQAKNFVSPDESEFENFCKTNSSIRSVVPFYEAQSFMVSDEGFQSAALIRSLPENVFALDEGFKKECRIQAGKFALQDSQSIVLGSSLAYALDVSVGDEVTLLALSGASDVALLSQNRKFFVKGIFHSGYQDLNASYAFVSLSAAEKYFGKNAKKIYGIKLFHENFDSAMIKTLQNKFPNCVLESWRTYNRSFFGVLRVEKNMLMILVLLIFVVAAINIFNGMRRLVFERRSEIAILSALGGKKSNVKFIFIVRGFLMGLYGSFFGVLFGLLASVHIGKIFLFASKLMYETNVFFTMLLKPELASFIAENPMYLLYASIPARIFPFEIFLIALFGLASPLLASYIASKNILKTSVAEVLHDE